MAVAQGDARQRLADLPLVRIVRTAACGVPGVVGISPDDVSAIDVRSESQGLHVVVHLVALPVPLPTLAAAVRTAVAQALLESGSPALAVDVWVDDLVVAAPGEEGP